MTRFTLFTFVWLASGCADKIDHAQPDAGPPADAAPAAKVSTTRNNADGTYTTIVDSSSMTEWIYTDLESGKEPIPDYRVGTSIPESRFAR